MSAASSNELFAQTYERLKRIGRRHRSRSDGETLCTTALVHELYLRLAAKSALDFQNVAAFCSYAAHAIRHLLIDAARQRRQRAASAQFELPEQDDALALERDEALMLDAALQQLERRDARAAETFRLHYFAGVSIADIARLLELSSRTVDRDWRYARAFLQRTLRGA